MSAKKVKIEICEIDDYIKKTSVDTLDDLIDIAWNYKHYENIDCEETKYLPEEAPPKGRYDALWKMIPILEELNSMIGMTELKNSIVNLVLYYIKNLYKDNTEGDMLHCVLYGEPGSGKTTAANIIAKIYAAMGFLSKGHVIKAKITDFIAKYLGQSEHQTMDLLNKAKGGVLFIDEVYSLSSDSEFAISAGNVLNAFLSENKHDFVCIIAGYEKDVKEKFFTINPGLVRRFPWRFVIDEYNSSELFEIFKKIVRKNGWDVESSLDVKNLFDVKKFKYAGGDMETLFLKCKLLVAKNTFFETDVKKVITYKELYTIISNIKTDKQEILTYFL